MRSSLLAVCAFTGLGSLAAPLPAWAQTGAAPTAVAALPFQGTLELGRPARPWPVRVEAAGDGVTVVVGRASAPLAVRDVTEVRTQSVVLAGGMRAGVVSVDGASRWSVLFVSRGGQTQALWTGRTDAHGDLGERTADALEVTDRTGDGVADLVVGVVVETTRVCGAERSLLFARALDPQSLQLRPVELVQLPTAEESVLAATRTSPGPDAAPVLAALHAVSASSTAGFPEDASALAVPRALVGEGPGRWAEGRGGVGRGEFVVARWDAPQFAIRAFAITPVPSGESPRAFGRPRSLWLVGDGGARLRVTFAEDPAEHPGARYWVTPSAPLAWRCVSVVLDEAFVAEGTDAAGTRTSVARVEAYTELDFGGGVARLAELLAADGDGAGEAARLLAGLGPAGADAVRGVWDRLSPLARRRSVRILAATARTHAPSRDLLALAARDSDGEVRTDALAALVEAGDGAVGLLALLVTQPPPVGDDAASAIARSGSPAAAVRALLDAVGTDTGPARPALRDALGRAGRGLDEAACVDAVRAWSATRPALDARIAAALGLSTAPPCHPAVTGLVEGAREEAESFDQRYRLVRATRNLPSEATLDAWLTETSTTAEEWMLRAEAFAALLSRHAPNAMERARALLEDPSPRVRAQAVEALADRADAVEAVAMRARRDRWPLVRASAVRALADDDRAEPILRAAIDDNAQRVRAAAVQALTARRQRDAWPLIEARLRDEREWPEVMAASAQFARALCVREAVPALVEVVARANRENAWGPDVDVASVALDTIGALGGPDADAAFERFASASTNEAVRAQLERARATPRCEP